MKHWEKLSEKTIYQNEYVSLAEDTVIQPDDTQGTYAHLVVPTPSVSIVPVADDGIYLVENYRYVIQKNSLEIPCGGTNEGEDLLHAAKRELKEETGFTAEKWEALISVYALPFICNDRITIYIARDLTPGETHHDAHEIIGPPKKYGFDEIKQMITEGKIIQTSSVAAILLVLNVLKK